ncbi:MAG: hypothetical protein ACKPKO_32705, partial [Candidatus Fonsibacter sp.]
FASASAGPTISDVRALNKIGRSIRTEPCVFNDWQLTCRLRLVGYPRAACQIMQTLAHKEAIQPS